MKGLTAICQRSSEFVPADEAAAARGKTLAITVVSGKAAPAAMIQGCRKLEQSKYGRNG